MHGRLVQPEWSRASRGFARCWSGSAECLVPKSSELPRTGLQCHGNFSFVRFSPCPPTQTMPQATLMSTLSIAGPENHHLRIPYELWGTEKSQRVSPCSPSSLMCFKDKCSSHLVGLSVCHERKTRFFCWTS